MDKLSILSSLVCDRVISCDVLGSRTGAWASRKQTIGLGSPWVWTSAPADQNRLRHCSEWGSASTASDACAVKLSGRDNVPTMMTPFGHTSFAMRPCWHLVACRIAYTFGRRRSAGRAYATRGYLVILASRIAYTFGRRRSAGRAYATSQFTGIKVYKLLIRDLMTVSWARFLFSKGWMLLVVGILAGCIQLPVDGPGFRDIHRGAAATLSNGRDPLLVYTSRDAVDYNYALIDINPLVLSVLHEIPPISFLKTFGKRRGPTPIIRVGAGDVLQTSIFEATSGGLFVPSEAAGRLGNYVTLPAQTVSGNGTISVPYAGPVQAAGRTVPEIQRDIESKLKSRAIEPQVLVNMTEQNAATVTVIGDTGQSRVKMTGTGERILDMISKAGGGVSRS